MKIVVIVILILLSSATIHEAKTKKPNITWMEGPVEGAVIWLDKNNFMKLQAYIQATQHIQWDKTPCQNLELNQ
jgi:hypothetical protein